MCACACVPACSLALALGECVVCSVQTEPRAGRWRDVVPPRARTNRARVWAQRRKRACWSCGECVCAEYDTAYRNFLCEILIRPNLLLALASYSASLFFSIQLSGGDRYALVSTTTPRRCPSASSRVCSLPRPRPQPHASHTRVSRPVRTLFGHRIDSPMASAKLRRKLRKHRRLLLPSRITHHTHNTPLAQHDRHRSLPWQYREQYGSSRRQNRPLPHTPQLFRRRRPTTYICSRSPAATLPHDPRRTCARRPSSSTYTRRSWYKHGSRVERRRNKHVRDELQLLGGEPVAVARPVVLVRALEVGECL